MSHSNHRMQLELQDHSDSHAKNNGETNEDERQSADNLEMLMLVQAISSSSESDIQEEVDDVELRIEDIEDNPDHALSSSPIIREDTPEKVQSTNSKKSLSSAGIKEKQIFITETKESDDSLLSSESCGDVTTPEIQEVTLASKPSVKSLTSNDKTAFIIETNPSGKKNETRSPTPNKQSSNISNTLSMGDNRSKKSIPKERPHVKQQQRLSAKTQKSKDSLRGTEAEFRMSNHPSKKKSAGSIRSKDVHSENVNSNAVVGEENINSNAGVDDNENSKSRRSSSGTYLKQLLKKKGSPRRDTPFHYNPTRPPVKPMYRLKEDGNGGNSNNCSEVSESASSSTTSDVKDPGPGFSDDTYLMQMKNHQTKQNTEAKKDPSIQEESAATTRTGSSESCGPEKTVSAPVGPAAEAKSRTNQTRSADSVNEDDHFESVHKEFSTDSIEGQQDPKPKQKIRRKTVSKTGSENRQLGCTKSATASRSAVSQASSGGVTPSTSRSRGSRPGSATIPKYHPDNIKKYMAKVQREKARKKASAASRAASLAASRAASQAQSKEGSRHASASASKTKDEPPKGVRFAESVEEKEITEEPTEEQIKIYRRIFDLLDEDSGGSIDFNELSNCFTRLNIGITTADIEAILDGLDTNGDGVIDFDEFVAAMQRTDKFIDDFIADPKSMDRHAHYESLFFNAITNFAAQYSIDELERWYAYKVRKSPHVLQFYLAGCRLQGLTDRQLDRILRKEEKAMKKSKYHESPYAQPQPYIFLPRKLKGRIMRPFEEEYITQDDVLVEEIEGEELSEEQKKQRQSISQQHRMSRAGSMRSRGSFAGDFIVPLGRGRQSFVHGPGVDVGPGWNDSTDTQYTPLLGTDQDTRKSMIGGAATADPLAKKKVTTEILGGTKVFFSGAGSQRFAPRGSYNEASGKENVVDAQGNIVGSEATDHRMQRSAFNYHNMHRKKSAMTEEHSDHLPTHMVDLYTEHHRRSFAPGQVQGGQGGHRGSLLYGGSGSSIQSDRSSAHNAHRGTLIYGSKASVQQQSIPEMGSDEEASHFSLDTPEAVRARLMSLVKRTEATEGTGGKTRASFARGLVPSFLAQEGLDGDAMLGHRRPSKWVSHSGRGRILSVAEAYVAELMAEQEAWHQKVMKKKANMAKKIRVSWVHPVYYELPKFYMDLPKKEKLFLTMDHLPKIKAAAAEGMEKHYQYIRKKTTQLSKKLWGYLKSEEIKPKKQRDRFRTLYETYMPVEEEKVLPCAHWTPDPGFKMKSVVANYGPTTRPHIGPADCAGLVAPRPPQCPPPRTRTPIKRAPVTYSYL